MLLILLQTPFWIFGLHGLIGTTHRRLADLVMAQRQNQFLAYNDTLTGLANRAQVMSSLTQIAKDRERRSPRPMCSISTSMASRKSTTPMGTAWATSCSGL